jgi:hypothetical protein
MTYKNKRSVFDQEVLFTPEGDHLLIESPHGQKKLAYTDIRSVNLRYAPTRVVRDLFVMDILDIYGLHLIVSNTYWNKPMDFTLKNSEFREFVVQFHKELNQTGGHIQYLAGISKLKYYGYIAMSLVIYAFLITLIFIMLFSGFLIPIAILKIVLIAVYTPRLISYLKKNKPLRYLPLALPAGVLPKVQNTQNSSLPQSEKVQ